MTAVTVAVTAAHISQGTPSDGRSCPVALAIRDAIPGLAFVSVGPACIVIAAADAPSIALDAPPSVGTFVIAFDCGDPAPPFTFTLDPDRPDGEPS